MVEPEEDVMVPIDIVDEIQVRGIRSSDGKTREIEMLDEGKPSSDGKTRESKALTNRVVPSNGKSRTAACSGETEEISSRLAASPPDIVHIPSSSKDKINEKVHAKILSAIQIIKSTRESKSLLENDNEFKYQYEALMTMKAKIQKKNSKKEKYDRRAKRQKEARRREGKDAPRDLDGTNLHNDRPRLRVVNNNDASTRENIVNKIVDRGGIKLPDDPAKSMSPSHKLKEEVNSKCSKALKVKVDESIRACLEWNKSGGETASRKEKSKQGSYPSLVPTL